MMRLGALVLCCGCVGVVGESPAKVDAGPPAEPPLPPATIALTVTSDLCAPTPDAAVQVLDDEDAGVLGRTDDEGRAKSVLVPGRATLLVTSIDAVPTLSAHRTFTEGERVQLWSVPKSIFDIAFSLAGLDPDSTRGHVVVTVVDASSLPIAGATVTLDEGRTGVRRYVGDGPVLLTFDAATAQTQANLGAAVFFNVPPGRHTLHVTAGGVDAPPVALEVRAGALTAHEVVATGATGSTPSIVRGTVRVYPPLPAWGGAIAPAHELRLVLHDLVDGRDYPTRTSDGGYSFELPFARRLVDITVEEPPYGPFRSEAFCVQPMPNQWTFTFADRFFAEQRARQYATTAPFEIDAGVIFASVGRWLGTEYEGIGDATVTLEQLPNLGPSYDDAVRRDDCVTPEQPDAGCAPGSHREGSECLVGPEKYCRACAVLCAPPTVQTYMPTGACRCLAAPTQCDATASCPDGTACGPVLDFIDGGWAPHGVRCLPLRRTQSSSSTTDAGALSSVVFTNVPAGEQVLRATATGRTFTPLHVRVTPGVYLFGTVRERR